MVLPPDRVLSRRSNIFWAKAARRSYMSAKPKRRGVVFKGLKPIHYGGREVWPLVEGGKGVSRDQPCELGRLGRGRRHRHRVSAVNADSYDPEGKIIPQIYQR